MFYGCRPLVLEASPDYARRAIIFSRYKLLSLPGKPRSHLLSALKEFALQHARNDSFKYKFVFQPQPHPANHDSRLYNLGLIIAF